MVLTRRVLCPFRPLVPKIALADNRISHSKALLLWEATVIVSHVAVWPSRMVSSCTPSEFLRLGEGLSTLFINPFAQALSVMRTEPNQLADILFSLSARQSQLEHPAGATCIQRHSNNVLSSLR